MQHNYHSRLFYFDVNKIKRVSIITITVLLALTGVIVMIEPLVGFWDKYIVIPVISKFNSWFPVACIMFAEFIYYVSVINSQKSISRYRMIFITTFVITYFASYHFELWNFYGFTDSIHWYSTYLFAVILVPVIMGICFWAKCIVEAKSRKSRQGNSLLEDYPVSFLKTSEDYVDDLYSREGCLKSNFSIIKNSFSSKGSFAIGISGEWGSGKSSYVKSLEELYKQDSPDILLMRFNLWRGENADDIVRNFFKQYNETLSAYLPGVSSIVKDYLFELLEDLDSFYIRHVASLFHSYSSAGRFDLICHKLRKACIRTVVVIDDLDRMNRDEILSVLQIIRSTANFPYVQFIVPYDKEYVAQVIAADGDNKDGTEYLSKIFNLEISLPKYEKHLIVDSLKKELLKTGIENNYIGLILGWLHDKPLFINTELGGDKDSELVIPAILKNRRDIIRFCNSFKLTVKVILDEKCESEVYFPDLFLLELLHYYNDKLYTELRDTPWKLLSNKDGIYSLLSKEVRDPVIGCLLMELFSQTNIRYPRIVHSRFFNNYFVYRSFDKTLSNSEMMNYIQSSISLKDIENIEKKKSKHELREAIIRLIPAINNKPQLNIQLYEFIITGLQTTKDSLREDLIKSVLNGNGSYQHLRNFRECYSDNHLRKKLELTDRVIELTDDTQFDLSLFVGNLININQAKLQYTSKNTKQTILNFLQNTRNPKRMITALSSLDDTIFGKSLLSKVEVSNLIIQLRMTTKTKGKTKKHCKA